LSPPGLALTLLILLPGIPGAPEKARAQDAVGDSGGVPAAAPLIRRLDPRDPVFRQYSDDVEAARRRLFDRRRGGEDSGLLDYLVIYAYQGAGEDLFSLAARCNLPYAALATLNRLSHPADLAGAGTILLPSMPGVFIPLEPETGLEWLLAASRDAGEGIPLVVRREGRSERFRFIPGGEFSGTERVFFLNEGFRFPLRTYQITSGFGPRINPVTGNLRYHRGLDLAAPQGTEVYASRDGVVVERGEDPVYGIYVILEHAEHWASLYGHLSETTAVLQSSVRSGTLIGRVGSTGQSTGPHLHFEIRRYGEAQDPGKLLFREGAP
jgi:murein DD-endopeptidase MepM/ murein hydrolase activator NlpD